MMTTMEEQFYGFCQFPGSKNHWKTNISLNFWFQEMSSKRDVFVNFLPQTFMTKYGVVSTYFVTFAFQKPLTCLQCEGRCTLLWIWKNEFPIHMSGDTLDEAAEKWKTDGD